MLESQPSPASGPPSPHPCCCCCCCCCCSQEACAVVMYDEINTAHSCRVRTGIVFPVRRCQNSVMAEPSDGSHFGRVANASRYKEIIMSQPLCRCLYHD